ncbi:hypothetical protein BDN67DRAFT_1017212 [Paxillus ammoniavirescens]|nr:hypothetical protein BDN67DRAFT_1017212 [Paxillus ammoniavirescens]
MKKTSDSGGQSSGGLNTTIIVEALLALISTLSLSLEAASQLSDAVQNQVIHQAHHEEGDPGDNHHTNIAQPSSEDLPSSGVGGSSASFPPITGNAVSSSSLSLDPFPGVLSNLPEGVSIGAPQSSAPPSAVGDPRPAVSGQPHPTPNGHYSITYSGVSFILPFQEEDSPFYLITRGKTVGVVSQWARACPLVIGVSGSAFHKVPSVQSGWKMVELTRVL